MTFYTANFSDPSILGDSATTADLEAYAEYLRGALSSAYPEAEIRINTRAWEIHSVSHDGDPYDIEALEDGFFRSA